MILKPTPIVFNYLAIIILHGVDYNPLSRNILRLPSHNNFKQYQRRYRKLKQK